MRIALLGAGAMGEVIARDLATWDSPKEVRVGDLDEERARRQASEHGFEPARVDVTAPASLDRFLDGADVVVNAVQYQANLEVMEGAVRAGAHYVDLGGLFHVTRRQLDLHPRFEEEGLVAVLGMGSSPGISNVHAADLAQRLDTLRSLKMYNASSVDRSGELRAPYSWWTILDEMTLPSVVFRDGQLLHFFGLSEAALRKLQVLISVGLGSTEPRRVGDVDGVIPRQLLVDLLEGLGMGRPRHAGFKDVATVAEGTRGGHPARFRLDTTAWLSEQLRVTGGAATVAAPASILARWLGNGRLEEPGVYPPERIVPPQPFYEELARRGIKTVLTEETPLA